LHPDISIIIVSYNVRYFLDQCLQSINKSLGNLSLEVIIVDNLSSDDSVSLMREKYPEIKLIVNEKNLGFSTANNIGIASATGSFILLLNPDTIVSQNTLSICHKYLISHPQVGAVCVRMIDGSGKYLPESKRGNPTFWASFTKMTGLYKLFPRSSSFNRYYMGHIGENEEAEIEVMTGAFMFMRSETVSKTGPLDEDFFMYGEDIDYSYRIRQQGYTIQYLPQTSIIHFKGESTRKASYNYIKTFYSAMNIFVNKHYKHKGFVYTLFLNFAVYFRTFIALFQNIFNYVVPILLDTILLSFFIAWLRTAWGNFYFHDPEYIAIGFLKFNLPIYVTVWVMSALLNGKYRTDKNLWTILRSVVLGTILILIIYALFNENFRNSRTIILAGTIGAFLIFTFTALLQNLAFRGIWSLDIKNRINYLIIGNEDSADKIRHLAEANGGNTNYLGRVDVSEKSENSIGTLKDLNSILSAYQANEVIFAQGDISTGQMIELMSSNPAGVHFRIAPDDNLAILSSNSKHKQGDLFTIDLNYNLNDPAFRREKRILDISLSIFLLIISPLLVWFQENKAQFYRNLSAIISGNKTFVTYLPQSAEHNLPVLNPGILYCAKNNLRDIKVSDFNLENMDYARHYTIWKDLQIIKNNLLHLDAYTRTEST